MACAVSAMIGMCAPVLCSFSRITLVASKPSRSGTLGRERNTRGQKAQEGIQIGGSSCASCVLFLCFLCSVPDLLCKAAEDRPTRGGRDIKKILRSTSVPTSLRDPSDENWELGYEE